MRGPTVCCVVCALPTATPRAERGGRRPSSYTRGVPSLDSAREPCVCRRSARAVVLVDGVTARYVNSQHLRLGLLDTLGVSWHWVMGRGAVGVTTRDAHREIRMDKSVSEEIRRRPASAARRRRPCKCIRLLSSYREKKDARRRRHRSQCLWTFVKGR